MKSKTHKKTITILLAGGISLLSLLTVYILDGMWPAGDGSIIAIDLNSQYLPLLYRFYDIIHGLKGLTIDFHLAGGINLYSDGVTELLNPFNYLLLLFPRAALYRVVDILLLLYVMAAAMTCCYALTKIYPDRLPMSALLSTCYALSFYMAYQYEIIRWMYLVVLFPLFFLTIRALLDRGRAWPYVLMTAYLLMLSLQIGIQSVLFTFIYSVCYMLRCRREAGTEAKVQVGRRAMLLGLSTVAGILISAIVTIPTVLNILTSARSTQNSSILSIISRHGLDDLLERLLEITNPVMLGMLVLMLILGRRRLREERVAYKLLCLVLLLLTVVLEPSNLIWHLGYYQCFSVRYGFMALFMTAITIEELADMMPVLTWENIKHKVIDILTLVSVICITIGTIGYTLNHRLTFAQAFSTLAISRVCTIEMLKVYGLMTGISLAAALLTLVMIYIQGGTDADKQPGGAIWNRLYVILWGFILSFATGVILFSMILLPQDSEARQSNESGYAYMTEYAQLDSGYDGHDYDEEDLPVNAALVEGSYSMSAYMPSGEGLEYVSMMERLGYLTPWVSVRSKGGSFISDELLGIGTVSGGIWLSAEEADALDNTGARGIELQYQLLEAMCASVDMKASDVAEIVDEADARDKNEDVISLSLPEQRAIYIETGIASAQITVDGQVEVESDGDYAEDPDALYYMGVYSGDIEISVQDTNYDNVATDNMKLLIINPEAMDRLYCELNEANNSSLTLDEGNSRATVSGLDHQEGILVLPLANIDGWQCDGAKLTNCMGGLLAIDCSSLTDDQAILTYHLPGLKAGIICLIAGILLLLLVCLIGRDSEKRIDKRLAIVISWIYVAVAAGFLLIVYILPNVGMVAYMGCKVLGVEFPIAASAEDDEDAKSTPILLSAEETEDGLQVVVAKNNLIITNKAKLTADSTENKDLSAALAGDGDSESRESRWSSENDWDNPEHYLQADLRQTEEISAIRIYWSQTNVCDYAIESSEDGKTWSEVSHYDVAPTGSTQTIYYDSPVTCRYIRVHTYAVNKLEEDLSLYYQNASITELEIYGGDCDSFLIETPVIGQGYDRQIPLPDVPDGYDIEVAGINYDNLLTEDDGIADTLSPVEVCLGYRLTTDGVSLELPDIQVTVEASDGSDDGLYPIDGISVREWRAADGDVASENITAKQIIDEAAYSYLGDEGYEITVTPSGDTDVTAATDRGLIWGVKTLEHIMAQTDAVPCGTIRDYPEYSVRGFVIDAGRCPIELDTLYEIVDMLSDHYMNTLQIELNNNEIIADSDYDGTVDGALELYSGFRLESDISNEAGNGITNSDLSYSKEEFRELIAYGLEHGVDIVPEIDTPAHSLAFIKTFPALGVRDHAEMADTMDITDDASLQFALGLWSDYIGDGDSDEGTFAGCSTLHLGLDEYYGHGDDYVTYMNGLVEGVRAMAPDKTLRAWASLSYYGGDEVEEATRDVELMIWNMDWADPEDMYEAGYDVINCLSSDLYIIPGTGQDRLDTDYLESEWQPNVYKGEYRTEVLPRWSRHTLGACYSMWNDFYSKGITLDDSDMLDRVGEPLTVLEARLWGRADR